MIKYYNRINLCYNNAPTVTSSARKFYDPKKLTSLLKQHRCIRPQIQFNRIFFHRVLIYLLEHHIFNNHESVHVYKEIVNKETIDYLIYGEKGKIWKIS